MTTKFQIKEATRSQPQRVQRPHRREQHSRHGQTLVEGSQAVHEFLACASGLVRDLYVTEEAIKWHGDVAEPASVVGVRTHAFAARGMHDLLVDARGVIAVISTPEVPGLNSLLGETSLVAAALDIADPRNLGTIIRTADAVEADAAATSKANAEPYSPKAMRSAAGSHFRAPCAVGVEVSELAVWTRETGPQVLAAEGTGEWELSAFIWEAAEARILDAAPSGPDLRRRTLWFVGNKAHGFTGCDFNVDARAAAPLYGEAESLNVSAALTVCAYVSAMAQRMD